VICTPHRAVSRDHMKNGVGGHAARVGEKCIQSLVGKRAGKRPLGRPRRRRKYENGS
jgi:hypothetical protein